MAAMTLKVGQLVYLMNHRCLNIVLTHSYFKGCPLGNDGELDFPELFKKTHKNKKDQWIDPLCEDKHVRSFMFNHNLFCCLTINVLDLIFASLFMMAGTDVDNAR